MEKHGIAREGIEGKLDKLASILENFGRVAVAFSGGIDSTFLLAFAHEVLGDKAMGITVSTPLIPKADLAFAIDFCKDRNIPHRVIAVDALACEEIRSNPPNRCYYCKKLDMGAIIEEASKANAIPCDGANIDDAKDYRPGLQATSELGISSPLAEAMMTKREIREQAKKMGLPNWDKPASACLASRIPYGTELDAESLERIGEAERFLQLEGFPQVRIRLHGNLARIEVSESQIEKLCESPLREKIVKELQSLGFLYVACDMQGYRMGSLNELLDS